MTEAPAAPRNPVTQARFLEDVYEASARCNKCSMCLAVCPTYVVNPVEWESARGRVALIRDAIEGKIALKDIEDGPLSTCLGCNNCVAVCAPNVPTADIVFRARQELSDQGGLSAGRRLALRAIFPSYRTMRALHTTSRVLQVTGLHKVLRKGGFFSLLGNGGRTIEKLGPLPKKTSYDLAENLPEAAQPSRGTVAFLTCCYQNIAAPEATEATQKVLLANGFNVEVPTLACSGLPARALGDRESEREMAVRNTDKLATLRVDAYVGDVASCTQQYKRYASLLEDTGTSAPAQKISNNSRLASHFLAEKGMTAKLGPLRWKVAIDEACSLPHDVTRDSARVLLSQIPNLNIVELEEAAMCCGGPGLYAAEQPERSEAILARKFEHIKASGAEVLVTENISCITQLRDGAKRYAPEVRVMHLFEVLETSLGRGAV